jgi:hypothetical protein
MTTENTCETINKNKRNGLVFNIPKDRYTPLNPYQQGFTQQQLDMRRKTEILQYNKTSNGKITKKQSWVNLVKGSTQRKQYSSYYIKQLQDGTLNPDETCPNDKFIPTSSKNAGVPGPAITLYLDPNVPLYNYNSMQITYGTQNNDEQAQPKWLVNYDTNVTDNNMQNIFTLNIRPSIDETVYIYSFTTSVGLYISGYTLQNDGTFTMSIPLSNLSLAVTYGGQAVTLPFPPTITYSPNFVQGISGEIVSSPATFAGKVYLGNLTFSNIWLNTYPNSTYDFFINYVPSYIVDKIDNAAVYIITNFRSDSDRIQEAELQFTSEPSIDPINTFSISGSPR